MHRFLLTILLLILLSPSVEAQQQQSLTINGVPLTPELVEAYRDLAIARQRLVHYRQVIQPQKQQALEDAIRLSAAEIAVLQRRLVDYEPFLAVGDYSAVRSAAEYDWLALISEQQNLRELRDKEIAQMRFRGETDDLYVYDVLRAAMRVRVAYASAGR